MFECLYNTAKRLKNKGLTLLLSFSFKKFGKRSGIDFPLRLANARRIEIGDDVFIGESSWLNAFNDQGPESKIEIRSGVNISGMCVLSAAKSIVIEEDVLIARNVYIADHTHKCDASTVAIVYQGIADVRSVRIGKGAWLCQNVVICPGVTIGKGAVIGANSVVKQNIPDYCIAVGSPAVVKRHRTGPTPDEI